MWRATANDVLDEDLRMQRLVEDLLFMARREEHATGSAAIGAPLVDLDDVVLEEVRRRHLDNPIDVTAVSAGQVRGDHDQLSRVVRNLVDNALRHASARVAVSVRTADGAVIMAVDDDGPGVDTQHAERVFERFGRADDARGRDDGGSGLGLAIVRSIVTDHGGTISVERSHQLGGASFIVRLPDTRSATA
jgi:signal transduction histidine kinase